MDNIWLMLKQQILQITHPHRQTYLHLKLRPVARSLDHALQITNFAIEVEVFAGIGCQNQDLDLHWGQKAIEPYLTLEYWQIFWFYPLITTAQAEKSNAGESCCTQDNPLTQRSLSLA